jgi:DNA-binding transcriptional ArsR family regulator
VARADGPGVLRENGVRRDGERSELSEDGVGRLAALGRAISDPIRVRMLGMMVEGRACCDLPDLGVPAGEGDSGICVCEFEDHLGMGQSKVSYHIKKLKEAGLVSEEKRGSGASTPWTGRSPGPFSARPRPTSCPPAPLIRARMGAAEESRDRRRGGSAGAASRRPREFAREDLSPESAFRTVVRLPFLHGLAARRPPLC